MTLLRNFMMAFWVYYVTRSHRRTYLNSYPAVLVSSSFSWFGFLGFLETAIKNEKCILGSTSLKHWQMCLNFSVLCIYPVNKNMIWRYEWQMLSKSKSNVWILFLMELQEKQCFNVPSIVKYGINYMWVLYNARLWRSLNSWAVYLLIHQKTYLRLSPEMSFLLFQRFGDFWHI